jgi:N-acetylglucosamine-6-phosphate deacetylase
MHRDDLLMKIGLPMNSLCITEGVDAAGRSIDVSIVDGVITDEGGQEEAFNAIGLTVVPGYIDLQVNGAFGYDFTENPTSIWAVGARLPEQGVTSFCPTIITSPPDRIVAAQAAIANRPAGYRGAEPIGLHIEGPYLSATKRGTHPLELLVPHAPDRFDTTDVAVVTVAPEITGVLDFIKELVANGVVVSLGHSNGTSDEATLAIDAGASLGTHILNAMAPMTGRDPGLAGVLMTDPRTHFGVIADGIHLAPEMLRLAWSSAPDRLVLVTDAIAATGMPEGGYEIGGISVTVKDGAVRNSEGSLAGSVLTLNRAVEVLMDTTGASLSDSVATATSNPAHALGRDDLGTLDVGALGDVTLLDGLEVVATIVRGNIVFCNQPHRLKEKPHDTEV